MLSGQKMYEKQALGAWSSGSCVQSGDASDVLDRMVMDLMDDRKYREKK